VTVGAIDPRMSWPPAPIRKLSSCRRARLGQDHGRRALRSTFPWTIYIQANVTVVGDYLASAAPLVQGQSIDGNQLTLKGDLTMLPAGIATDASQVMGRSARFRCRPARRCASIRCAASRWCNRASWYA
jgi:flagella basal body P-ring formation protein FlgA